MATDYISDKHSIKNLLFVKAIPNYVIPVPTDGHKVHLCTECGDRFILESSHKHHIDRKSVNISYMCRPCGKPMQFYNRCNLLSHIRSHTFKTATINVFDLKVEPLSLSFYNKTAMKIINTRQAKEVCEDEQSICFECKKDITHTKTGYLDRANHYMQYTKDIYTCPVCMFVLPTECGLKAHIRLHLKRPPFYCPECGRVLHNKSVSYPFYHDCDGFKMMRATSRIKCPVEECHLIHPNDFKQHIMINHFKKVFKCPVCVVACFSQATLDKHLKNHPLSDLKAQIFFQSELCPGRLVIHNQIDNHLNGYTQFKQYPCWTCGSVFKEIYQLLDHHIIKHCNNDVRNKNVLLSINKFKLIQTSIQNVKLKDKGLYRVIKRCGKCNKSFTYKCNYSEINVLPTECPFKCTDNEICNNSSGYIVCHMCKNKISENWEDIKSHYASRHKSYKCLDASVVIPKLEIKIREIKNKMKNKHVKFVNKKVSKKIARNNKKCKVYTKCTPPVNCSVIMDTPSNTTTDLTVCNTCSQQFQNKELLEEHMISHRDPCMAYQCMECGLCFVVKPSFSTHLLVEHRISNVEDYIIKKNCYNESALSKYQIGNTTEEPLQENQCKICREQFDNMDDLTKHFRVHGMAFLMKHNSIKSNSP